MNTINEFLSLKEFESILFEENKVEIVKTFEGVPEGFVKITLPELPSKKMVEDKVESNDNIKETT